MVQQVELCGGPCDGALVVVPDDALRYIYVANNTSLNSIRPQQKALPKVQVGYYVPVVATESLPKKKWAWTGYRDPEATED